MRKLIILALAAVLSAAFLQAKESGNFYIDSFVRFMEQQGSPVEYDGRDVVMTEMDDDPGMENSIKAVGADTMASMLKEQFVKSIAGLDSATRQLLGELANAGCGFKIRYVCGSQTVETRLSADELNNAVREN